MRKSCKVIADPPAARDLACGSPQITTSQAAAIVSQLFGVDGVATLLPGECDQNFRITSGNDSFLLKISSPDIDKQRLEMQVAALAHVELSSPDVPAPRVLRPTGKAIAKTDDGLLVRLFSWLNGVSVQSLSRSSATHRSVATFAAKVDRGLRGFFHATSGSDSVWNLSRADSLRMHMVHMNDQAQVRTVTAALELFEEGKHALGSLRAQFIHNDIHHDNVLIDPDDPESITGLLDFGDMMFAPLVNELAIAIAHQLYGETNPAEVMAEMAGAYHVVTPLEEIELDLIPGLVAARLASREILVQRRIATQGDAGSYSPAISAYTWAALSRLLSIDQRQAKARLRGACGFTGRPLVTLPTADLLTRREKCLGPTARQFYQHPFRPVRANGVWIYDEVGAKYLDAYNNVPHVGHCHPHVTAAITRQANTLNTNTRYLDDTIVEYSERITATLGHCLDTVVFVCTGSEANDLAGRLARTWSGNVGFLTTDHAFHGNSAFVSRLDTYSLPTERLEPWLAAVRAPRTPGAVAADQKMLSSADYAGLYRDAIKGLGDRGYGLAAFYMCPLFASDGLYSPPPGYLDEALGLVRETGALIVSDEVQSGFGRVGDHMWGYQALGIVPDIVTMGKPIGNGFPLGVLVTRREIMERFAKTERYFNTFGGNSVAASAALAVLDVLERENLVENACAVGAHLKKGLEELANISPHVSDVRGRGLFVGVEIAEDGKPAPNTARQIIERMRCRGVLIGVTGWGRNLLKIRPPMCVTRANASTIVESLADVLASEGMQPIH